MLLDLFEAHLLVTDLNAAIDFYRDQHSGLSVTPDPEALLLQADDVELIDDALRSLPPRFRELLVLRELEGLSYQELADVLDIPIGTVMSGLSRARRAMRGALVDQLELRDRHLAPAIA